VRIEIHQTAQRRRHRLCDGVTIERDVRQRLADKVTGNMAGLWLLLGEHLRLGTWDLLRGWTGRSGDHVEPRLAMQLVHEAALCLTGLRRERSLNHRDFELANGLPFLASDRAIHDLLDAHSVADAQRLQTALGRIRQASGHFNGRVLAVDPHRIRSYSRRRTRRRKANVAASSAKMAQTFFCLDAETHQPVCFTMGTCAQNVTQATPDLMRMANEILRPQGHRPLALADSEHFTARLLDHIRQETPFDLLVPMPNQPTLRKRIEAIAPEQFMPRWAGLATAKVPYAPVHAKAGPFWMMAQRFGERPQDYSFNSFLCTGDREEVDALTLEYPKRWHVEEFFHANQALGWDRAGTQNLNIRYGQMTMALLAQAALHQFRQRLDEQTSSWDAAHVANDILRGLQGDVRVHGQRLLVTYYNASKIAQCRDQFEHLPERLQREGIDPRIPWLCDFELDFRFK